MSLLLSSNEVVHNKGKVANDQAPTTNGTVSCVLAILNKQVPRTTLGAIETKPVCWRLRPIRRHKTAIK